MIGKLICWWTQEHNWSKWSGQRYTDGRTYYWMRICRRCKKIESTLREPRMKTSEQIKKEIEALKTVRPNVRPRSMFGDDNLAALDAEVQVLTEHMDGDDVWDEWPEEEDEYVRTSALAAVDWLNDGEDPDDGNLADGWPLKEKPE